MVQLKALQILAEAKNGMEGSSGVGDKMGVRGKSLGGVFSSISRQRINGKPIVEPWGKNGRGLRWKLNEKVITNKDLKNNLRELLAYE